MLRVPDLLSRLADIVLIAAGAELASSVGSGHLSPSRFDGAFVTYSAAFALVLFPALGVYKSWRGRSTLRLTLKITLTWIGTQACGLALMFALHRTDFISCLWFGYWTAITGAGFIASRLAALMVLERVRCGGIHLRNVAVVGCGAHCQHVVRKVEGWPDSGFRISAILDARSIEGVPPADVLMFDDLMKFSQYVRSSDVREIWLALPLSEEPMILHLVSEFRDDLVNIRFMPDLRSLVLFDGGMTDLIGAPVINLIASPLPPQALAQKEMFDRIFAAVALLALAPLLILIAVAVKFSSKGPVFFTQYRKGVSGRVFKIYKFRTMYLHDERSGVVTQATKADSRITRIGRFLRRTSLDELPQFFNVLRGEMSVVGPRPHAIEHDEHYRKIVDDYIHRYRIKPGITGWAQINGFRGETDRVEMMQRRVEHDLYYLRNWSFWLDIRIVAVTVAKGMTSSNAY